METSKPSTRRKALTLLGGGLLGASQLPKAWTRPVVNAVILPAHAQTTTPEIQSQPDETPAPAPEPQLPTHFRDQNILFPALTSQDSPARSTSDLLSLLISDAQAGGVASPVPADLSIDSPDGINFTAKCNINVFQSVVTLTASGTVNGSPATLSAPECGNPPIGTLSVTSITTGGAPYSITLDNIFQGTNTQGVLPVDVGEPATSTDCPFGA